MRLDGKTTTELTDSGGFEIIYLLCMIKVRVRWCTYSLWRML